MTEWMALWKWLMIVSVTSFSIMAVWVTIQGARDIKALLQSIRASHEQADDTAGDR